MPSGCGFPLSGRVSPPHRSIHGLHAGVDTAHQLASHSRTFIEHQTDRRYTRVKLCAWPHCQVGAPSTMRLGHWHSPADPTKTVLLPRSCSTMMQLIATAAARRLPPVRSALPAPVSAHRSHFLPRPLSFNTTLGTTRETNSITPRIIFQLEQSKSLNLHLTSCVTVTIATPALDDTETPISSHFCCYDCVTTGGNREFYSTDIIAYSDSDQSFQLHLASQKYKILNTSKSSHTRLIPWHFVFNTTWINCI